MIETLLPRNEAKAAGHRFYIGDPCKHGHSGKRLVKNYTCYQCTQDCAREWTRRKLKEPAFQKKYRTRQKNAVFRNPGRRIFDLHRRRFIQLTSETHTARGLSMLQLIGCDPPTLVAHIEAQFTPGMSWSNLGAGFGKWQLDHKMPVASFDPTSNEEMMQAFHYLNLQPLWRSAHEAKSAADCRSIAIDRDYRAATGGAPIPF